MIIGKNFMFEATRSLPKVDDDHPGKHTHRNNYKVEILIDGPLAEDGIVMDFQDVSVAVQPLIEKLNHGYLNDHIENPTAEHIAIWFWNNLIKALPLAGIKVWETPTAFAQFTFVDAQLMIEKN